ncbi:MAG TPA: hypothetical protein VIG99_32920, partial [Myxococcaceae bacterium]
MHALHALQSLILAAEEVAGHGGEHAAALARQITHPAGFLWLIPFFPLLGSAINAVFGLRLQRRFGKLVTSHIAIGAMALAFAVAAYSWVTLLQLPAEERYLVNDLWSLLSVGDV